MTGPNYIYLPLEKLLEYLECGLSPDEEDAPLMLEAARRLRMADVETKRLREMLRLEQGRSAEFEQLAKKLGMAVGEIARPK